MTSTIKISKTLKKGIEQDIPYSWIGRVNIMKMSIQLKAIYRLNPTSIKITTRFFTKNRFIWGHIGPCIPEAILNNNKNC